MRPSNHHHLYRHYTLFVIPIPQVSEIFLCVWSFFIDSGSFFTYFFCYAFSSFSSFLFLFSVHFVLFPLYFFSFCFFLFVSFLSSFCFFLVVFLFLSFWHFVSCPYCFISSSFSSAFSIISVLSFFPRLSYQNYPNYSLHPKMPRYQFTSQKKHFKKQGISCESNYKRFLILKKMRKNFNLITIIKGRNFDNSSSQKPGGCALQLGWLLPIKLRK